MKKIILISLGLIFVSPLSDLVSQNSDLKEPNQVLSVKKQEPVSKPVEAELKVPAVPGQLTPKAAKSNTAIPESEARQTKQTSIIDEGSSGLNAMQELIGVSLMATDKILLFDDPAISGKADAQANKLYFVQITALSKFTDKMTDRFSKYAAYGDVYKVDADGATKIRIGSFQDVNEAIAVLNLLKKNGLKDAFIVADILDSGRATMLFKSTASAPKATPNTEAPNTKTSNFEDGKYKIRVSEYKAPDWFDVSKINDLGNIEHWTKGGWTIIVLGNYQTEQTAKEVMDKLKTRGFKEAYIVVEENGKLYRQ
ncbi:MAG: SPOR domain-containing protein [Saprospiraceae bacterium]|nr:SPOR domain-containing protein [Saprospiraceae bacterium]